MKYKYASATSSGLATKPTLNSLATFAMTSSCASFECPCLSHSSVRHRPGTTVFARILFALNSIARPCVSVIKPPFSAPPIEVPFPGRNAASPEVKVSEPPGFMMSWAARALATITLPQNLTPKRFRASPRSAVASGPRMTRSMQVKTTWSSGASEMSKAVKAASSRRSPTKPVTGG
ncbi:Carbonyl reductase family member 4 [Cytospora mali]|uniref:Carbonyl reductase family member 4 n=1 Tax=Cytospora mali TaxID=578113 RepID=A0A194VBS6_CYTMA|nr:Carbonyl reductase family member 4 [Valsa mali var. pyri (nom. inval.)]